MHAQTNLYQAIFLPPLHGLETRLITEPTACYIHVRIYNHVVIFAIDGIVVNEPYLLYAEEISVGTAFRQGIITCQVRGTNPTEVWRDVRALPITAGSRPLRATPFGAELRLSHFSVTLPSDNVGLWSYISEDRGVFGFIGIYHRGQGKKISTM